MTPERDVIAEVLRPGDPTSGDEGIFQRGDYANYRTFGGGTLDADTYLRLEQRFHSLVGEVLGGTAPFEALQPLAEDLCVAHPFTHDRRPLLPAPVALPDEVLADIMEDQVPESMLLVERLTGDAFARPTIAMYAALAWVPYMDNGRRPVDAWADEEEDERPYVIAARTMDRAPVTVWVDGVSMLPLAPRFTPPEGPAGVFVGRAYRVADGWGWSAMVPLPAAPALEPLVRRLTLEGWQLRRRERRCSWEDILRQRPELVYRAAMEGARRSVRTPP
jgi:hypothetical protein